MGLFPTIGKRAGSGNRISPALGCGSLCLASGYRNEAGDGNRTRDSSLEERDLTTKLRPRVSRIRPRSSLRYGGGEQLQIGGYPDCRPSREQFRMATVGASSLTSPAGGLPVRSQTAKRGLPRAGRAEPPCQFCEAQPSKTRGARVILAGQTLVHQEHKGKSKDDSGCLMSNNFIFRMRRKYSVHIKQLH